jgi:hypothetical protein
MSTKDSTKAKQHFVPVTELAKVTTKNLILDNPVTNTSKTGHSWTTSAGHFKLGGEKADFLFEGEPQIVFGICGKWPMSITAEEQTMDNIEGLQVCYPLTSQETVKAPTANETIMKNFLKGVLWGKCWESMQEFNDKDLIDGPAGSACTTAIKKKNPEYALKPVFAHSSTKNEKTGVLTIDTSKSEKMYVELVTQGKGSKMRCLTPIYGPGNKLVSYMKFFSNQANYIIGTIHPVYRWKGTFWGAHGKNTHGGSVKLEIVEMNFTPRQATTLSYPRLLNANNAVEEKSSESGSRSEGDSSFKHPSGTGIVKSDFAEPEDENVNNLLSSKSAATKNNTNDEKEEEEGENDDEGEGGDEDEEEKQKAEEEAKAKAAAKARADAAAKKKAMIAKRNAANKKAT